MAVCHNAGATRASAELRVNVEIRSLGGKKIIEVQQLVSSNAQGFLCLMVDLQVPIAYKIRTVMDKGCVQVTKSNTRALLYVKSCYHRCQLNNGSVLYRVIPGSSLILPAALRQPSEQTKVRTQRV